MDNSGKIKNFFKQAQMKQLIVAFVFLLLIVTGIIIATTIVRMKNERLGGQANVSSVLSAPIKPLDSDIFTKDSVVFDATVKQDIYTKEKEYVGGMIDSLLLDIEEQFSPDTKGSEIFKVNTTAGMTEVEKPVIMQDIVDIIEKTKTLSDDWNGLFEMTAYPLKRLWNVGSDNFSLPSKQEIKDTKKLINNKNIEVSLENNTVWLKKPFMKIDLRGITEGYACGKIFELAKEQDITSAIFSVGGSTAIVGDKPNGMPFDIKLIDPLTQNSSFGTLISPDTIISTVGVYEPTVDIDSMKYKNILDPKTGYPAKSDIESVTVISEDGILADFLSTTFYVGGLDFAIGNLESSDFSVIILDKNKNVYLSSSLKETFKVSDGFTIKDTLN